MAEIETRHFLNTSLVCHYFTNLFVGMYEELFTTTYALFFLQSLRCFGHLF